MNPVTASMTAQEVARREVGRQLAAWQAHEPGARLGDDPEELHQLRVALRRIDAIARDFRGAMPALAAFRPVFKRVLRALGAARDLDVALAELAVFERDLGAADRPDVEPLRQLLSAGRARARFQMLRLLDAPEVRQTLRTLEEPPAAPAADGATVGRAAPVLLRRRYRRLRRALDRLRVDDSVESHHAARGEVKKLRYALESVAGLYGKPAVKLLKALRRSQERLGVEQDAAVAARRLHALAASPPEDLPPATLFLMGRLAQLHERTLARARSSTETRPRRLRRRWRRLRACFEE